MELVAIGGDDEALAGVRVQREGNQAHAVSFMAARECVNRGSAAAAQNP